MSTPAPVRAYQIISFIIVTLYTIMFFTSTIRVNHNTPYSAKVTGVIFYIILSLLFIVPAIFLQMKKKWAHLMSIIMSMLLLIILIFTSIKGYSFNKNIAALLMPLIYIIPMVWLLIELIVNKNIKIFLNSESAEPSEL